MKYLIIIYRNILRWRYRVEVTGFDLLKKEGIYFFVSNHQALIDPQITFVYLRKYIKVSPVVVETYTKAPLLKQILSAFQTISVPDISAKHREQNTFDKIKDEILNALKKGNNIILYPSGQLSSDGKEKIVNKKSAWAICENLPEETKVIAVCIDGLWGSMWSKAPTGKTPSFFGALLKGMFFYVVNLFVLLPKRKVRISLDDITDQAKNKAVEGKKSFNGFLEEYFNNGLSGRYEKVPHYFFLRK